MDKMSQFIALSLTSKTAGIIMSPAEVIITVLGLIAVILIWMEGSEDSRDSEE